MMMARKAWVWAASTTALLSASLHGTTAHAQAESSDATNPVLEEVVVTSDRRESFSADLVQAGSFRGARQLDTPLTVSVIPDELIRSQQAQGLHDALRNSAGVTTSQT